MKTQLSVVEVIEHPGATGYRLRCTGYLADPWRQVPPKGGFYAPTGQHVELVLDWHNEPGTPRPPIAEAGATFEISLGPGTPAPRPDPLQQLVDQRVEAALSSKSFTRRAPRP